MTCPTTAEAQSTREAAPAASRVGELRLLVDAQIIGSLKKKRTQTYGQVHGLGQQRGHRLAAPLGPTDAPLLVRARSPA